MDTISKAFAITILILYYGLLCLIVYQAFKIILEVLYDVINKKSIYILVTMILVAFIIKYIVSLGFIEHLF